MGAWPARIRARAAASLFGTWAPQARQVSSQPMRLSQASTAATWNGSPLCEAQARASSTGETSKASAAPLSTVYTRYPMAGRL